MEGAHVRVSVAEVGLGGVGNVAGVRVAELAGHAANGVGDVLEVPSKFLNMSCQ